MQSCSTRTGRELVSHLASGLTIAVKAQIITEGLYAPRRAWESQLLRTEPVLPEELRGYGTWLRLHRGTDIAAPTT